MNTVIKRQIEELAKAKPHQEICGFIYRSLDRIMLKECHNISVKPERNFEISSEDYLDCVRRGIIIATYHSHPEKSELGLTNDDIDLADEMDLPIRMFHLGTKEWHEYIPKSYKIPLEGQTFIWGEYDCYGLIRTFLRQEKGIYIRDYDRDETFPQTASNIILENFEKEDYRDAGSTVLLKKHDILLFQCGRTVPQHFAVYIGRNRILHHPINCLSQKDIINQKWLNRLRHVLRHKSDMS